MHARDRLVVNCQHLERWESGDGEKWCTACGTRRFTEYGALRPPGLPSAVMPSDEERGRADRMAAAVISRTVRHLSHWGLSDAALWLAV